MIHHSDKKIKKPTHLLLGVRKGASSWIWKQFCDHPEVYVHPKKELYFFNKNYNRGLKWYFDLFNTECDKIVETTPDYFDKELALIIKKDLPSAKLFVCLRNPIERAYSHWKFGFYLVGTCKKNFIQSWNENWNKIRTRGLYDKHLVAFGNVKVFLYDDLIEDSLLFINKIYDFVGVKRHVSKFYQEKWMPGGISENGKEKEYEKISKQKMSKVDYEIVKDYYFQSIKNTEEILNRELKWLNS